MSVARSPADSTSRRAASSNVNLAWANLSHDKKRLAASIAGVTFAVLVMFVQVGFLYGLLDSSVLPIERLAGEIVLTSPLRNTIAVPERFPRPMLTAAAAVDGVADVRPVYLQTGVDWRDPVRGQEHELRVIAVDPARPGLIPAAGDDRSHFDRSRLDSADFDLTRLAQPGTAFFDRRSKEKYFPEPPIGATAELAGRRIEIADLFRLGTDFTADGNVLIGDATYAALFPFLADGQGLTSVDLGVVRLEPDASPEVVRDRLAAALPAEIVQVRTRGELAEDERWFWFWNTPAGFVFGLGTLVGFLVGVVICYQILFAEVSDHMKEFATIKAMGYPPRYLTKVILQEALFLSGLGFAVGLAIAGGLYALLSALTGLEMQFTFWRVVLVGLLTVGMCTLSGLATVRKVHKLDPAELF